MDNVVAVGVGHIILKFDVVWYRIVLEFTITFPRSKWSRYFQMACGKMYDEIEGATSCKAL